MSIRQLLGKAAPTILAFAGIGLSALCAYETHKVTEKEVEKKMTEESKEDEPEPSKMDNFKKTVTTYKVPIIIGAAGAGCIVASNHMHNEKIGELVGALVASSNIATISQEKIKVLQKKLTEEITKNVSESNGDVVQALKTTKDDIEKELTSRVGAIQGKASNKPASKMPKIFSAGPASGSCVFEPGPDEFVINLTGKRFTAKVEDVKKKIYEIRNMYINNDGVIGIGDTFEELGVANGDSYLEDNLGYNHEVYMGDYDECLAKDPNESEESFRKRVEVTRQDNIRAEAENFITIREFTDFGGDIVPHKYFIWFDPDYIYDDYMDF